MTVILCLAGAACNPTTRPSAAPSQLATPNPAETGEAATPQPTQTVDCRPEQGTVPPALLGDPCPGAGMAVELAVAPVRLPIRRIVIEPGPFYCGVLWPGVQSPPACYGPIVIPGQFMHAWVTFERSDEVAAVMLGRDLPPDLQAPATTPIAWNATLVKVEVPPAGWAMP